MLEQNPSQIFKLDFRDKLETEDYRCLSILKNKLENSIKNLTLFNDETLAPHKKMSYQIDETQTIIVIPIVGAIDVIFENSSEFININQVYVFTIENGNSFTILNPYENELVNFLQFRFYERRTIPEIINFDFSIRNKISALISNENFKISIGVFDLRYEDKYELMNKKSSVFSYILKGAFEFQNRLLEDRDAITIWDIKSIEMEALTENAVILLIEKKAKNDFYL